MEPRNRVALLLDFDNAHLECLRLDLVHCQASQLWVRPLVREVERVCEGTVEIRRAYGNTMLNVARLLQDRQWNPRVLREFIGVDLRVQEDLANHGFQMIHCPTQGGGKNRADILMSLDSIELATQFPHIDTFAILSHDSDFSPLVHRLRALGRRVALVSVGAPNHRGMASLEAMANLRIVYNQAVVDRAGYDLLMSVVDELRADGSSPLSGGVSLGTIGARMRELERSFQVSDLGYARLGEFVDDCIDEPLEREGGQLFERRQEPAPAPPRRSLNSPPRAAAAPRDTSVSATRAEAITSALRAQKIRPMPQLRSQIAQWVRSELVDPAGAPKTQGMTYGQLRDMIKQRFACEHSNSAIQDALMLLVRSGVIDLERVDGLSMVESTIQKVRTAEESQSLMARFVIERLEGNGFPLAERDIPYIAAVVFGSAEQSGIDAAKHGMVVTREADQERHVSDSRELAPGA